CKARQKLSSEAIQLLLRKCADEAVATLPVELRIDQRRVFAIDGTRICTRRSEELGRIFEHPTNGNTPQLLACVLFDVAARAPVDCLILPHTAPEREPALELIERNLKPGDVVLLDRGYPGHDFIARLKELGIDFVIRCS